MYNDHDIIDVSDSESLDKLKIEFLNRARRSNNQSPKQAKCVCKATNCPIHSFICVKDFLYLTNKVI